MSEMATTESIRLACVSLLVYPVAYVAKEVGQSGLIVLCQAEVDPVAYKWIMTLQDTDITIVVV